MSANQWDMHADLFDERMGTGGDALHTDIIDPLISAYAGDVTGKTVLDLGCGNGYLAGRLTGYRRYVGIDSSARLLEKAVRRYGARPNVAFMNSDAAMPVGDLYGTADIVVCNMVLQYVSDLDGTVRAIGGYMKPGSVLAVIIDHPSHALFLRAQELAGKTQDKFLDSCGYFAEGQRRKHSLWNKAVLNYRHRTVATYLNAFCPSFKLDRTDEVSQDNEMPRILGMKWIRV